MDDATFELLTRIDEGFEEGSGPYVGRDIFQDDDYRGSALKACGHEGSIIRHQIMLAMERERDSRKRSHEYKVSLDGH